jgi:hypothetical protein
MSGRKLQLYWEGRTLRERWGRPGVSSCCAGVSDLDDIVKSMRLLIGRIVEFSGVAGLGSRFLSFCADVRGVGFFGERRLRAGGGECVRICLREVPIGEF